MAARSSALLGALAALAPALLIAQRRHGRLRARTHAAETLAHRAVAERERSERDLADVIAVAAHDLQEPLRSVTGFLELLERRHGDELGAEASALVGHATAGAGRMRRLVEDLLDVSRAGTRTRPPAPVDLSAALADVLRALDASVRETGAHVDVHPLPTVPGDAGQLRQLLQNLVGNALKFHRDGAPPHVVVAAEAAPAPDGRPGWAVRVSDDGIGIDPALAGRAFAMFARLGGDDGHSGSGVGLTIARRVAEGHHGTLEVAPRAGGGSVFTAWLPGS